MSRFFDRSLREIIGAASSSAPTPGGGSVSAIVACLGVAMTAMVCNLTIGKAKYRAVEPQVREILETANGLIGRLEDLVDADMAVFNGFMSAYRMPRNNEEEKAARQAAVQEALKEATGVPLEIARACLDALKITCRLAAVGNKMAVSDAGVAALVLEAALKGALLNVDSNIPMIDEPEFKTRAAEEKDALILEAGRLKEAVMAIVRERMNNRL